MQNQKIIREEVIQYLAILTVILLAFACANTKPMRMEGNSNLEVLSNLRIGRPIHYALGALKGTMLMSFKSCSRSCSNQIIPFKVACQIQS